MTLAEIIRTLRGHANALVVTLEKEELKEMANYLENLERLPVKKNGKRAP